MSRRCACAADRAWAVLRGSRLHRVTFSRSLADYIARQLGPAYTLARVKFALLAPLEPSEASPTGLYAVVSHRGRVLRLPMIQGVAEEFRHETRSIWSCAIVSVQPKSKEEPSCPGTTKRSSCSGRSCAS